jgi:FKBP-type peptidyl-prolyl cis-trans isomerase 2
MKIGESKQVTVTPDEGYGGALDKNVVIEQDKE